MVVENHEVEIDSVECHSPCSGRAIWDSDVGVYVCDTCGRVGDKSTVSDYPLFTGGQEKNYIRFVGVVTLFASDYHIGPWVVVKSPYGAKEVIKSLDESTTGRMWHSDMSCWLIKRSHKQEAKEELGKSEYDVIDFTKND